MQVKKSQGRAEKYGVLYALREEYQLDVGNGHSIFGVDWEKTINDRKIKFRT